jgi:hypothetical protein
MRFLRDAVKTVAFLLSLCSAMAARAQSSQPEPEQPQAFRVEFSAAPGCGDREAFAEEVLKRTERLRPAEPGEPALTFLVNIGRTVEGARGQVAIREPDGNLSLRDVPGSDCPEVLSAMALIAALTVDPLARPDREVPVAARRRRPQSTRPALPLPRKGPPRAVPPPPTQAAEPESRGAALGLGTGARVNAHGSVMPELAVGVAAYIEVVSRRSGLFSPSLRVGAVFSRHGGFETELASGTNATAAFEWLTARVELCPVRLGSAKRISLRPCAYFDAGRLKGSGSNVSPKREKSVFWTAAGAELSLEARLIGALTAGAEVGILLPFRRDRFFFVPERTAHEISAAGLSAGLGLGLHFF